MIKLKRFSKIVLKVLGIIWLCVTAFGVVTASPITSVMQLVFAIFLIACIVTLLVFLLRW
jgi:hypothetical protein